jgi:hypothetical protein
MCLFRGSLFMLQNQIDEADTGAYTRPAWPSPDGFDKAHPMILNSPTHDLANPLRFTFDDSEVSRTPLCLCNS